jgi:hypothetical protein
MEEYLDLPVHFVRMFVQEYFYLKVANLRIPVALAPIERVGPAFPAFLLRLTVELPVIEFDVTLHVSSENLKALFTVT